MCIILFIAVLILLCYPASVRRRNIKEVLRSDEAERNNLLGSSREPGPAQSQHPPPLSVTALPQATDDSSARKRSRRTRLFDRFYTCCSSDENIDWQHANRLPCNDNAPLDDEIISVHGGGEERERFEGPLPFAAPTDLPQQDDVTSEYEFTDFVPADSGGLSAALSIQDVPVIDDNASTSHNVVQPMKEHATFNRTHSRNGELPPFPRPVADYNPHSQSDFHNPVRWAVHQQQPARSSPSLSHTFRPQTSRHYNHYVSLHPSSLDYIGARRNSFYDNSLPRDSPLYEYYQRQQLLRQELPGTRNINQYFS